MNSLHARATELDLPRWKQLHFVSSILFFSAESILEFKKIDSSSVTPLRVDAKYGKALQPRSDKINNLTLTTKFMGKFSHISLIFEPNLNTLQRVQLDSGKKHRYKAYQFFQHGVHSLRMNPEPGQEQLPFSEWTNKGIEYYTYPQQLNLKLPIIDSTNLFYIMSSGLFSKPGDRAVFTVFVKNQLLNLIVEAKEIVELDVDYRELKSGRTEYIEEELELLRVSVNPVLFNPMGNGAANQNSDFKFLGLKGNLQFYIETNKRLLMQLSGNIDFVGTVDIVLHKVEFK